MQTWDTREAARRWREGADRRAATLGLATERLIHAARLTAGMHVLDVAAGTGETTIIAARQVLPGGSVLAVDISASMLEVATETARATGLSNVETSVQDAAQLELPPASFDAAISRLGLMFLSDLPRGLRAIRVALKPNGRLAAIVWSTTERNPYMGSSVDIVREVRGLPSPSPPIVRAFSLAGPGIFQAALADAGFHDVTVEAVPTIRTFESVDEALELLFTASSAMPDLLADASQAERDDIMQRIRQTYEQFRQSDGSCVMPGEVLLGSAAA